MKKKRKKCIETPMKVKEMRFIVYLLPKSLCNKVRNKNKSKWNKKE